MNKILFEAGIILATLIVVLCALFCWNAVKADHPNHTKVYTITLEVHLPHETLKIGLVFLNKEDIHELMEIFKHDRSGGYLTMEAFNKLMELKVACEVIDQFYEVTFISSHGWYDIYEVKNSGTTIG